MYLFMLDVDGTLIDSYDFDSECFRSAIEDVMGVQLTDELGTFLNVTDIGILEELIEQQGMRENRMKILRDVKSVFLSKLRAYIASNSHELKASPGAIQFVNDMKMHPSVVLAIATGGWEESARMKLRAAGFDISQVSFASCSDAMTRSEIMALAAFRAKQDTGALFTRRVYFGDGEWDKMATNTLGYEFVAVGNNVQHHTRIPNFAHYDAIFGKLGLSDMLKAKTA
ncbi:HAD family hydrolase [Enterovibrio norvegicus]|uniref:Hydrolase, haloacid dehalogenase-like family protein n=1 Tax=Enterovibrio norvegicus TaxID=188144 RepID=A0A2N7L3Z9_9GAMM|nr:HAD hydrolase-like protein [Enterovibrio norvegicus]PML76991.1 hydrolase, haloacid dehalogenase-like family protein [Enterovibrio norvegicus]PMN69224.1 hydrolase, haloacid dehalogenase-like family protein [Enterovibrio norvegicus]PMN88119.1 hydrolase, haloacid dehalogenase-like family protein [Enterovibrio norvegicus]